MVFDRSKIIYPPLRQENRRAGEPEEEFTTEAQRIQREERESQKEDSPQRHRGKKRKEYWPQNSTEFHGTLFAILVWIPAFAGMTVEVIGLCRQDACAPRWDVRWLKCRVMLRCVNCLSS